MAIRLVLADDQPLILRMPDMSGLDVVRQIAGEALPTRTVLLTAMIEAEEELEAMRLGAGGVVLKETAPARLVLCVRKVHAGEPWL